MELVSIQQIPVWKITPGPENSTVYKPIDPDAPQNLRLAELVSRNGVTDPIILTTDYYVISGHRRLQAAITAGMETVPCVFRSISYEDDSEEYLRLLVDCNSQREKSNDERLREEIISIDKHDAYNALVSHREERSRIVVPKMEIVGTKRYAARSAAKSLFTQAILRVLKERKEFLPISVRAVHYALLNFPPLKHASKPKSIYRNDPASYKSLCDLLKRLRYDGIVPWESIVDPTRPVCVSNAHPNPRSFIRRDLRDLFRGYWRDLMQSQPNHIEIAVEKNTVLSIIQPVGDRYTIPITSGRGFCSRGPIREMAERFRRSGREQFILILITDHDPDGMEISQDFARSMRDQEGIENLHPVRPALTTEQIARFNLPPNLDAKKTSPNFKKYSHEYGPRSYELEALPPADLQEIIFAAVNSVIDVDAFNRELEAERDDSQWLEAMRERAIRAIGNLEGDDE